jgi:deoxyribonuclease-4
MSDYRVGAYFHPGKITRLAGLAEADIASSILMNLRSFHGPLANYKPTEIPVVIHAPYTINIAHSDAFVKSASYKLLVQNAQMAADIGALSVTFHGGTWKGTAWKYVLENYKRVADTEWPVRILIENAANLKHTCTAALEDIQALFELFAPNPNIGFTFDTAHAWSYLETGHSEYASTVRELTGDRIWLIHANGSYNPAGSGNDRHAPFHESVMPLETIISMILATGCKDLVCETKEPALDIPRLKSALGGDIEARGEGEDREEV